MNRKILSIAVAIIMLLSLVPMAALAASTNASITGFTIGGVSIGVSGAPAATYDAATAYAVYLSEAEATDAAVSVTLPAGATVTYDYTETDVEPTSFAAWTNTTLADGSFVWAKVVAQDASTTLIYKFMILYGDGEFESGADGEIRGEGVSTPPIIKVGVPTNMHFVMDPYQKEVSPKIPGSQIIGTDYELINRSNVAIQVGLDFDAELSDDVDELLNTDTIDLTDLDNPDKQAYMAILAAKDVNNETLSVLTYDVSNPEGTLFPLIYDEDTDGVGAGTDEDEPDATVNFLLEGNDGVNVIGGKSGVASFTFYGKLNPGVEWRTNDLAIVAAYTLTPVGADAYDDIAPTLVPLNVMPGAASGPAYDAGFLVNIGDPTEDTDDTINIGSVSKAVIASTPLSIPFYFGGQTIDTMTFSGLDVKNGAAEAAAGDILEWTVPTNLAGSSNGNKTITITLSGGGTYTFTFNLTA
jgi:hypothetical protein